MRCENCGNKNGIDPTTRCSCGEDDEPRGFCEHVGILLLGRCRPCGTMPDQDGTGGGW